MFKKIVVDFTILAVSFFGMWFLLSQVNFVKEEKPFEISHRQEEKIGRVLKDFFTVDAEIIDNEDVRAGIKEITNLLKENIDSSDYTYRIIVIESPQINAFSLPGGYIVIYSELINFCENPEELAGIIAHEMGHNENHDVLKRMAKNIGVSVTFNTLFGNSERANQILQQIISTRFDRMQETMADEFAVDLMIKSGLNPEYLALFFERILEDKPEILSDLDFLMTHPADDKRIEAIRNLSRDKTINEISLDVNWKLMKEGIN